MKFISSIMHGFMVKRLTITYTENQYSRKDKRYGLPKDKIKHPQRTITKSNANKLSKSEAYLTSNVEIKNSIKRDSNKNPSLKNTNSCFSFC